MAELIPPMIVTIEARIGKLEADLKKATDAVDKFGKQAKANASHSDSLTSGFKKMAGAIGGLFALQQVTRLLGESTKAAVDDAKAQTLLANSMVNTVGATKSQIAEAERFIANLQKTTGILDNELRPALAVAVRSTGDMAKAQSLLSLATDVSAGTGKDLVLVTKSIARAMDGNVAGLQKLVPGISKGSDALDQLRQKFSGAAKAAADADPYMRLNVAMDTIKESIGTALIPLLSKFSDWLTQITPQVEKFFKDLNDPTTEVGAKWKVFTDIIKGAFDWFTKNITAVTTLIGLYAGLKIALGLVALATEIQTAKQWLLNIAMNANPIGLLVTAVLALAAAFAILTADTARANGELYKTTGLKPGQITGRVFAAPKTTKPMVGVGQPGAWSTSYAGQKTVTLTPTPTPTPTATKVDPFVDYLKNTQKKILSARADYDKAIKSANDKYGALIQQYSDEMTSIIKQSMDRLRGVFATATATDVGSIFKNLQEQGTATADVLLKQLQDKLEAGRKLAENAATLAGLGYSQTFIEQVVSQGTDTGNALAEALKIATPEQAKAIQETFRATEVLSNTGMDGLAKSLYEKSGLATDELKGLFDTAQANMVKAQKDLQDALTMAAQSLNDSLSAIEAAFTAKLASMGKKASAYKGSIAATFGMLANNFVDTSGGVGSVININTTANTNASAESIANATLRAAKFGMPAVAV